MKLPRKKRDETSAAITPMLGLIVLCSGLFILTAYARPPGWWFSPGTGTQGAVVWPQVVTNTTNGAVTTNYVRNDYAVVTQGQLKHFTVRAVDYLNSALVGGAGTNLNNMVSNWAQDYATNGYATNTANPTMPYKPSDWQVENVGQLKYIGNLVWAQLVAAGYTNAVPSWLAQNTNTDNAVANLGQLKEVFNFNLWGDSSSTVTDVTATLNDDGSVTLSWTLPTGSNGNGITIAGENADGTWTTLATLSDTATNETLSASDVSLYTTLGVGNSSADTAASMVGGSVTNPNGPPTIPAPPTGLTGSIDSSSNMNLTWTASTGATSYQVQRETLLTGTWSTLGTASGTTYQDTTYGSGGYHYSVSAVNTAGTSGPSDEFPHSRYAVIDLGTNIAPIKVTNSGLILNQSTTSFNQYGTNVCFCWSNGTNLPIPPASTEDGIQVNDINESGTIVGLEANFTPVGSGGYAFDQVQEAAQQWTLSGTNIVAGTPDYSLGGLASIPLDSLPSGSTQAGPGGYDYYLGFSAGSNIVSPIFGGIPYSNPDEDYFYETYYTFGYYGFAPWDCIGSIYANDFIDSAGDIWCTALTWSDAFAGYVDAGENKVELGSLSLALFEGLAGLDGTEVQVLGVNNSGGTITTQYTFSPTEATWYPGTDPYLEPAATSYFLTVGESATQLSFAPAGLNNAGAVVGTSTNDTTGMWYDTSGNTHTLSVGYPSRINAATNSDGSPAYEAIGSLQTYGRGNALVWDMGSTNSFNPPRSLEDLLPATSGWTNIAAASINDGGAIVGTATYSGTNTAIAAGSHGVMLLPLKFVRETSPGSGDFEPITDNGLDDNAEIPVFASETGQGTTETVTGPYSMTAVLSADLSSTSTATINVTYTASGGGSYTGTLTETGAGSGVFKDSGGTNVLTLTPSTQTTSSTDLSTLSATITIPSLSISSQPVTLSPTDTLTYQASTMMSDVVLSGALSTTTTNTITASFYNASSSTQNYRNTLTETGVNTRVFQDSSGDTTLTMTGYTGGTSMNFSVSTSEFSPTSFSDTLTETGTGSLQFSNYQTTIGTATDSTPETDGQGVFYVQFPGSTATSITLVSGSNSVTTTASPVTGQPNLLRTGKLVLLAPGDTFSASDITTLTVSPPSGGGNATVQLQMYGQTIVDPAAPNQAYLGCGMPWGTDGGTTYLTQIQNILTGTTGSPGLGWTVPNVHARLVKSDFINALQTHSLFFIFTHGLTPKSNPAIPYLVSFQFFNSANPDDHVQAELVPTDVSANIGNNHPELVFFDACFSADQTTGSAAPAFQTNFHANAYVGWAHGQFDWVGVTDGRAFFNALKQHNSIQNAANAALNATIIRGIPLLVLGDPTVISKTIIDKGSQ